jgi:hypothetical protein
VPGREARGQGRACAHLHCGQGGISEGEFAAYTADLNTQIENLQLIITAAEADLAANEQERFEDASTEAWLLTLRERLAEVEVDTEEGRRQRRELVELLVEKITVSEQEDGSAEIPITYRFGEPSEDISHGEPGSVGACHCEHLSI